MKMTMPAVLLLCAWQPTALAQSTIAQQEAKSNIIALEHAWDQALEREDAKALSALFANSLLYVDYDGKLLTKIEYLERVKANATKLQQVVAQEMTVELFGDTAIVVGTYKASGTEDGKPYLHHGRFVDTWVLTGKNWICVASAATPVLR
jgi:ketosteroid isomerase-like protein